MYFFQPFMTTTAAVPLAIAYNSNSTSGAAQSTPVTISGVGIGTASASRIVYMTVSWGNVNSVTTTLNSATIGGVAATIYIQRQLLNVSLGYGSAIISAAVPTGTTATVVLTFSSGGTNYYACVGSYPATGVTNTTSAFATTSLTSNNPATMTVNSPAGGFLLTACCVNGSVSSISGVTKNFDTNFGGSYYGDGGLLFPSASGSNSIVYNGTSFTGAYVAASFI